MPQDYPNLDFARQLMSCKSTSDYGKNENVSSSSDKQVDMQDAGGCLAYINLNYRSSNKSLMQCAVSNYVCNDKREQLYESVRQLTNNCYQSKKMKQKYAHKMAHIVVQDAMQKTLSKRECASILGVSKATYSEHHAPVFNFVSNELDCVLSIADDIAGDYWRKTFMVR